MKRYFFFSKIGVVALLVFFAFFVFASSSVFAQHQYRRPSKSDIDWLLGGNNKSKLPNRNSIDAEPFDDEDTISPAVFHSQSNLPEPCQSVKCSKNGSKLRSPSCGCEYCAARDWRDVEPCGKVRLRQNPQKIKQINFPTNQQLDQQSTDNKDVEKTDEDNYNDEQTNQPIVAVESGFPAKSTTAKPTSNVKNTKNQKEAVIEFSEQKPIAIETDSKKDANSNDVKIAYPDSEPVQLPTPQTNTVANPKTNAVELSTRPESRRKILPAPQLKTKQKKYTNKTDDNNIDCNIDCDCVAIRGGSHDPFCPQYVGNHGKCEKNIYGKDCPCERCGQLVGCGSGEIIADTCVGILYNQISRLRNVRLQHNARHNGGKCNCWLCADLNNPDMTGNGIWNLQRVAEFGNITRAGSLHVSPNMFLSRSDIATHFNAEARNRVWVDYRQFNNATTTALLFPNGNFIAQDRTINQFTFGLEKRIGTQTSVEVRVPLLYQFSSDSEINRGIGADLRASNTELGNITLSTKYVFARTKRITLTTGLGVLLPTAEDWEVKNFEASMNNKAYNIISYVAAQWHPNDSTFGHLLVQADIPVSKNELRFREQRSKIEESQIIQVGVQLGRWFYRNEYGTYSCRIGGFLELDYAVAINSADNIVVFDNNNQNRYVCVGSTKDKPDYLSLSAGLPISFGQLSINNAIIVPLSDDHQFSAAYNFSLCRKF
ncbi:MAG: hypothetical protein LBL39_08315 [Planctomycetaceae bacterium]|nr:hypothetical protein [Planctomycetaceae bacterium]